jgi:hypothetical protein
MHVDVGFQYSKGAKCLIVESGPTRDSDGPAISPATCKPRPHPRGTKALFTLTSLFAVKQSQLAYFQEACYCCQPNQLES